MSAKNWFESRNYLFWLRINANYVEFLLFLRIPVIYLALKTVSSSGNNIMKLGHDVNNWVSKK